MKDCLLSIITISKNDCQGLLKTLGSVQNQDYPQIEHIVIDGDSKDGTKELLRNYVLSKTFTYCSEPDSGISGAFNKGLDRSKGHLIFFLNSGDVFASETVISEVIKSYLDNKWKCAEGITISSSYTREEIVYIPPKLSSSFLHYFMFLPHQGFFCETALHKHFRFDESIKSSMDYDLFIRMLKDVEIFYLSLIISKREPGGISSQSKLRLSEYAEIRRKYAHSILDKVIVRLVDVITLVKDSLKIDSPFARKCKASSPNQ
jgi:putative colanic acid biosynthesis glycosyltransferase